MRVLILTCNTGGGHNSAALALEEYFHKEGIPCDIADFLGFGKNVANNIICNGHVFIYKYAPKLFEWGYKKAESDNSRGENSFLYKYCSLYANNLNKFLNNYHYDCIVSVHVFASIALDYIKKHINPDVFACHVSTDYSCYPEISNTDLNMYFIPHKNLTGEFIENNIKEEKIIPSGIPIKEIFYNQTDTKKESKKKIGVPEDKKLVIIAGGSMGCGPMAEIASILADKVSDFATVAVICGSNEKMREELSLNKKLHVCGFVTNIEQYMNGADLLLTKAGGLTITEAAAINLPTVFINAVSGCETYNRNFFEAQGYALSSDTVEEVVDNAMFILKNEKIYNNIYNKLKEDFKEPAQKAICSHLRRYMSDRKNETI